MDRKAIVAALAPALVLYACDRAVTPEEASPAMDAQANETAAATSYLPLPAMTAPVSDGVNDGRPNLTPPALTPEAERGEKGARNVLLSFARAIELQEYGQAWAMLGPRDREKWSKAEFARMFADLGKTTVAIPHGTMEGAAGSSYYTAPVTITANAENGRPVRIEGEAVLRRVNDVAGGTPAELRWHFEKLSLDWTH